VEHALASHSAAPEILEEEHVLAPRRAEREVREEQPFLAPSLAEDEMLEDDRRWLLLIVAVFVLSVGLMVVTYHIYHATGPHPQAKLFLRQVKHVVRLVLPGLKRG
jgi:hypothetical protein